MSYIKAEKVQHGDSLLEINLPAIQRDGEHALDLNLDEGESLVAWKELF